MNKNLKNIIKKIHLWLGLTSGIVVFILGITGCILAFEDEIKDWVYADKLFVEVPKNQQELPFSKSLKSAQNALDPTYKVQSISIQNKLEHSIEFRHYTTDTTSTSIWYWRQLKYAQKVYVNPYTAEVVKQEDPMLEFFRVVVMLHWSLLMTNDIGQTIIGWSVIIFVIMLITGIILWWPKNKMQARKSISFQWTKSTRWRRKNYDLHNVLGLYSTILLLVIALTSLMWAFDWFESSMEWLVNGGKTINPEHIVYQSDTSKTAHLEPIDKVYEYLKTHHSKAENYFISIPKDKQDTFRASINYSNGGSDDMQIYFDQYSGERIASLGWEDKTNGEKLSSLNYDIHTGSVLGLPGKILAFFASLIAASLPITGFLIWWGRKKKKKKGK